MLRTSLKTGVGLRPLHYSFIESVLSGERKTEIQWFEAISENYMDTEGRPIAVLEAVRSQFPIALHGVGMSLGTDSDLNLQYLEKLRKLAQRIDPFIVSDHLCWTGTAERPTHDLLPIPYSQEAVDVVSRNIDRAQSFLGREIAIENVSSYLDYHLSEMSEWEFITAVQAKSGCKLLLDVNNVYVNSYNHGFDGKDFISGLPLEHVVQLHLAGHTDMGSYLFDTHSTAVCDSVWELLNFTRDRFRANSLTQELALMIEWDEDIPEWQELESEALKAREVWGQ